MSESDPSNRRSEARQAITLHALVHPRRGRSWMCSIRDFCRGGLLLMSEPGQPTLEQVGANPQPSDPVHIHFSLPEGNGQRHFRLRALIARVFETGAGVGVRLPEEMDAVTLAALERFAGGGTRTEPVARKPGTGFSEARDTRISERDAEKARQQLRRMMERALPRIARTFFERADKDLLVRARDAASNQLQTQIFESMSQLERKRKAVEADLLRDVLEQLDTVHHLDEVLARRRGKESRQATAHKLALVDTERFEEWLAVAEIVSKAEARSQQPLSDMRKRMALIARPWGHKEVNPVSPAVITRALDEALDQADIDKAVRQTLYRTMQEALLPLLRNLYGSINKLFDDLGVFPSVESLNDAPAAAPRKPPQTPPGSENAAAAGQPGAPAPTMAPAAPPAWPGAAPAGAPGGGGAAMPGVPPGPAFPGAGGGMPVPQAVGGILNGLVDRSGAFARVGGVGAGGAAVPPDVGVSPGFGTGSWPGAGVSPGQSVPGHAGAGPSGAGPLAAGPAGAGGAYPTTGPGGRYVGGGGAFSTARELLTLQRHASLGSSAAGPMLATDDPTQAFAALEVVAGLSELQQLGVVRGSPLRSQLVDVLRRRTGDPQRKLSVNDADALQVVENLVSSIDQDELVPSGVKDWVRQLEVTLAKVAAAQPDFLNSSAAAPHAAIQVLNQLARLGNASDAGEGVDREVSGRVDDLMKRLVEGFDGDAQIFQQALAELNPLVDRQGRAYQGNVERTVRASEGQQRLNQARRAVVGALEQRVADRDLPAVLVDLLNPGWRNLLVHSHLRHGADSAEWRRWLYVLDQLASALGGRVRPAPEQATRLLDDVRTGLESISYEPARRGAVLAALGEALAQAGNGEAAPARHVEAGTTASVLGLEGVIAEANPPPVDATAQGDWAKTLERARRLKPGDWIALTEKGDRPSIVTIAFIGDEHATFVLVNRKGIKVRDLTLRDMAQGLIDQTITVLDEFDLPLMERATHRMLQNMHNQLAYLAAHDEMTGLINRKEFEKRLDKALETARSQDYHHVVTYLDIDQFKVINNTAGHTAGDELLKQVSALLKRELRGTRHTLARLGGDEFGVLLERTSDEDGKEVADRQLDAIRRMRFDHEEKHFSVTASVGLVAVDSSTADGGTALKLADAACYAAKDAGRNRIQVHAGTDARLNARRGVMEWVTQIDRALDEDRLILNCQRIAPIRSDSGDQVHYEILLTMVDVNGTIMPPKDFVAAAETYNRMAAVDRWVVRHALNWMATHRRELETIGGFSINISGHSVNDDGFADFVLRQFSSTRVPTGKVCFELTETAAIANFDSAIAFMNQMTLIGCKFSLDDFGSGLSSYSYLRNLPVDYVKIDGVFVKDLATSPGDYAVVKSINEIAHFMGKKTVAEFVESNDILDQLREIGVDFAQGYGIERPRRLEEFFKV